MITLKKKKGSRKLSAAKRIGGAKAVARLWIKRAGIYGGGAIFVLWLGAWVILSDLPQKTLDWSGKKLLQASVEAGFSVNEILVEGRHYTDPDILRGIINTQKGDPLFAFDPAEARAMIEKISWVKSVQIERRLPGTIYIGITEREPLALWQRNKKLVLIDNEGEVLTSHNLKRFDDLMIVTGIDAARHAPDLILMLRAEPELRPLIEAASRVGERRWNLKLKNNVTVKLPEKDMGLALRKLAAAQSESKFLEKEITQVDIRDHDRIVIRTKPGQVQTYNASMKSGDPI